MHSKQKPTKVIEKEGEIDEEDEDDGDNQDQREKDKQEKLKQLKQDQHIANSQKQSNDINDCLSDENKNNLNNEGNSSLSSSTNSNSSRVFDDIIGLKEYYEEYMKSDIELLQSKSDSLKEKQEENQKGIEQVRQNINQEEKIQHIRSVFGMVPYYIMRIKALKKRISKVEEHLAVVKHNSKSPHK